MIRRNRGYYAPCGKTLRLSSFLRFLTADRGYLKRIKQSAQRANIHLLASKPFNAPADVEDRLRKILI